jgi:hypothetical protein
MARLAGRLIDEGRIGEALSLLAPHIDLFVAAASRQGKWQRLHDRLSTLGQRDFFVNIQTDGSRFGEAWPKSLKSLVRFSSKFVTAQQAPERAALDIFQLVHRSPLVVTYLAEQRPDLAIPFLRAVT